MTVLNAIFAVMFVIGLIYLAAGITKNAVLLKITEFISSNIVRAQKMLVKAVAGKFPVLTRTKTTLKKVDTSALKIQKAKSKHYRFEDIHVDPVTWNVFFRPVLSFIGSLLVVSTIWLVIAVISSYANIINPINFGLYMMMVAFGFLYFVRPENETEVVPETKFGALATWIGMPLPLVRTTGDYQWTGKRLGFGRSRKISKDLTATDANGFIILGTIPFQVWKSAEARNESGRSVINVPAKNRAEVKGSLTINFRLKKPRLWLDAENPELTLGDQARQEYQEMMRDINDTDVPAIQPVMKPFLTGTPIITSFIPDSVNGHKPGAIIRDRLGIPLFTIPEEGETEAAAVERFRKQLLKEGDTSMLQMIRSGAKKKGTPQLRILRVSNPITKVLEGLGAEYQEISFSDIEMSDPVKTAAAQASSESDQRTSQLASARTQAEARKLRAPTPEELANPQLLELNTMLAAAQDSDGDVKVIHVSGGNALAAAAVAGALNIGNKP